MLSPMTWIRSANRIHIVAGLLVLSAASLPAEDFSTASLGMVSPTITPMLLKANVGVDVEAPADVPGQDAEYQKTTYRASLQGQVYHDSHQELVLTASYAKAHEDSTALFPENIQGLPQNLYDLRVGALYRSVRKDGTVYGFSGSIGNSSPTQINSNNLSQSATLFMRQPARGGDCWLFFLSYSSDRAVLNYVPFPGFVYFWNPNPKLHVIAGLPIFAAVWTPSDLVRSDLFLSGFGSAHAGINDSPFPKARYFKLNAAFDWGGDVFKRENDPDHTDHIIFRSIRYTAGAILGARQDRFLRIYGGWATNRQIIEGRDLFDNSDHIDIKSGAVFGASASYGF